MGALWYSKLSIRIMFVPVNFLQKTGEKQDVKESFAVTFKQQIAQAVAQTLDVPCEQVFSLLETPPNPELGDYALPCFAFAKVLRKAPQLIAKQIVEGALPGCVEKAEVAGGYANFTVDKAAYARLVLDQVLSEGEHYGAQDLGHGRTVCIDYSSINIAKQFHIGHLSSTAIGHALYNLYNFMGYKSVGINHLGDWGTQFGKLLAAYELWGDEQAVKEKGVEEMTRLYVKFHAEAEKDPSLEDKGRAWFKRIEQGDKTALALFDQFKQATIQEVMKVYDLLGITFDSYNGEAFYNDKMQPVVDELREKNLLTLSEGAYVVDLEEDKMPPCIILKSDGTTLYATRDLAAAFYRKKTYDFAKCLYVVAYQQNLHFRQLFKVVEKMGYEWAKDMEHVAFGMVSMADGTTLSTRKGNVILLKDVLHSAIERAGEILEEKSPNLADKKKVAEQVGVGAVVFGVLYNARIKDIGFSYDRALAFDGETAPYLQYTGARCCSVMRKAPENLQDTAPDDSALAGPYAAAVIRALDGWKSAVLAALEKNEPYLMSRALIDLAQAYNRFYYEQRIITEDSAQTKARLQLTQAVRTVLKTGLELLGIAAPERM